jgi:hypothetical protein
MLASERVLHPIRFVVAMAQKVIGGDRDSGLDYQRTLSPAGYDVHRSAEPLVGAQAAAGDDFDVVPVCASSTAIDVPSDRFCPGISLPSAVPQWPCNPRLRPPPTPRKAADRRLAFQPP